MIEPEYEGLQRPTAWPSSAAQRPPLRSVTVLPGTRTRRLFDPFGKPVWAQLAMVVGLLAATAMIYLAQANQGSVAEVTITSLESTHARLLLSNAELQTTATGLQAFPRIETIAGSRLGMSRADLSRALWIQTDVPRLQPMRSTAENAREAARESQPLAWLGRFARYVRRSL